MVQFIINLEVQVMSIHASCIPYQGYNFEILYLKAICSTLYADFYHGFYKLEGDFFVPESLKVMHVHVKPLDIC